MNESCRKGMQLITILAVLASALISLSGPLCANGFTNRARSASRQLNRRDYADRLRAMWLGETIANWTGLITEGQRQRPPFYTDEDWGTDQGNPVYGGPTIVFAFQEPWLADDDTDIEYVYLHLMQQHDTTLLSAEQIADGWIQHINDPIWETNQARRWMDWGALPPVTGMGAINSSFLMNNAQLITEIFGALAPGMPDQALRRADLPISVTSAGYAAHAAQFYIVLYSLATQVDQRQSGRDQIIWLVEEARRYIPDTSKTADIADFVLADFLDNPDVNDWERTRDRVYERYHRDAADHGFAYRGWLESSVNFATGLIALLYGEGDFKSTVQIGTLSGWDSDNGTATMGGLLGLMTGYEALAAQFPETTLSDRYRIHRTRDTLPDYLPDDPVAEDTFTMMAERMLPYVEQTIIEAGGSVADDAWTLPPIPAAEPLSLNPSEQLYRRSANNRVRLAGGTVQTSATGEVSPSRTKAFADGAEHDFSGREVVRPPRSYTRRAEEGLLTLTVMYDRPVEVQTIRLIEGGGGGFSTLAAEVLVEGEWQPPPDDTVLSESPDPNIPCQMIDFVLPTSIQAQGIRVTGRAAEPLREVTIAELDALAGVLPPE
jgi:hypothetical protein